MSKEKIIDEIVDLVSLGTLKIKNYVRDWVDQYKYPRVQEEEYNNAMKYSPTILTRVILSAIYEPEYNVFMRNILQGKSRKELVDILFTMFYADVDKVYDFRQEIQNVDYVEIFLESLNELTKDQLLDILGDLQALVKSNKLA